MSELDTSSLESGNGLIKLMTDYCVLDDLLKLHKEEELIRLAYRAKKAGKLFLNQILLAEIEGRTPE